MSFNPLRDTANFFGDVMIATNKAVDEIPVVGHYTRRPCDPKSAWYDAKKFPNGCDAKVDEAVEAAEIKHGFDGKIPDGFSDIDYKKGAVSMAELAAAGATGSPSVALGVTGLGIAPLVQGLADDALLASGLIPWDDFTFVPVRWLASAFTGYLGAQVLPENVGSLRFRAIAQTLIILVLAYLSTYSSEDLRIRTRAWLEKLRENIAKPQTYKSPGGIALGVVLSIAAAYGAAKFAQIASEGDLSKLAFPTAALGVSVVAMSVVQRAGSDDEGKVYGVDKKVLTNVTRAGVIASLAVMVAYLTTRGSKSNLTGTSSTGGLVIDGTLPRNEEIIIRGIQE